MSVAKSVASLSKSLKLLRQSSSSLDLPPQASSSTNFWIEQVEKHFLEPATKNPESEETIRKEKALKQLSTLVQHIDKHEALLRKYGWGVERDAKKQVAGVARHVGLDLPSLYTDKQTNASPPSSSS